MIEEVALAAMLPPSVPPMVRSLDSDLSMEIIFEDDEMADAAATRQFNRFSSPYERIELSEVAPLPQPPQQQRRRRRPTTFAKTIAATIAKGTPSTGVPSLAGDTLRMPAMAEPRPTVKMAAVVPANATVPFERVWFDEEELAAIEEPTVEPKASWWWLAISLAAGAAAVAYMASLA